MNVQQNMWRKNQSLWNIKSMAWKNTNLSFQFHFYGESFPLGTRQFLLYVRLLGMQVYTSYSIFETQRRETMFLMQWKYMQAITISCFICTFNGMNFNTLDIFGRVIHFEIVKKVNPKPRLVLKKGGIFSCVGHNDAVTRAGY